VRRAGSCSAGPDVVAFPQAPIIVSLTGVFHACWCLSQLVAFLQRPQALRGPFSETTPALTTVSHPAVFRRHSRSPFLPLLLLPRSSCKGIFSRLRPPHNCQEWEVFTPFVYTTGRVAPVLRICRRQFFGSLLLRNPVKVRCVARSLA